MSACSPLTGWWSDGQADGLGCKGWRGLFHAHGSQPHSNHEGTDAHASALTVATGQGPLGEQDATQFTWPTASRLMTHAYLPAIPPLPHSRLRHSDQYAHCESVQWVSYSELNGRAAAVQGASCLQNTAGDVTSITAKLRHVSLHKAPWEGSCLSVLIGTRLSLFSRQGILSGIC